MKNYLKTASNISDLLDKKFKILGFRFGIDPILGLIPGGGDVISLLLSLYIVWIGVKIGLPEKKIYEMIKNTLLDFVIGLPPGLGDVADFFFKPNIMNMKIIRQHMEEDILEGEIVD